MTIRHDAFQYEELGTRIDLNKLDVYSHCVTLELQLLMQG